MRKCSISVGESRFEDDKLAKNGAPWHLSSKVPHNLLNCF
jgi:hypothetical protein